MTLLANLANLSVGVHCNGWTQWHFKGGTLDAVISPGFFRDCADMLAHGDHIIVSASDGSATLVYNGNGTALLIQEWTQELFVQEWDSSFWDGKGFTSVTVPNIPPTL